MSMQSGCDINHLAQEAQIRWLKPVEVFSILQNYEEHQLTHQIPQKPASGSLYLFNKRVLKFFRKDGHRWRRRRDQRTIAEAHERLKVGNVEALNCYYAHGEENPNFQRRSYWMLDPQFEHIVLVHYRDIHEALARCSIGFLDETKTLVSQVRQSAASTSQFSTLSSSIFSPSPNFFTSQQPIPSFFITESYELDIEEKIDEVSSSSLSDLSRALRRIEQQLSLNDDELGIENEDSNDLEDAQHDCKLSGGIPKSPENLLSKQLDDGVHQHHQLPGVEADIWKEMLASSNHLVSIESQAQLGGHVALSSILNEVDSLKYHACSPLTHTSGITLDSHSSLFNQDGLGRSLENIISLTVAPKQKFTICEISPEWCYTSEGAKIIIIGSFLSDPSECAWACMIGDTEVPVQIIQEGVLRCHAPSHLQGKVNICITSGNRESCSEVREFEYRDKPNSCRHNNELQTEANKSSEELSLLVRFVQMLVSDLRPKKDGSESRNDLLGKSRMPEHSWSQIIDAILVGPSTSSSTLDWLLQELLKDKLEVWLSSKLQQKNCGCSLSKKEQGIIHMVAGLGFEWALQPILNSGVNINFRDINGWTALHWAARFGREKMVAALIASGASAGAVTDPSSQDPTGKTPASVAATYGHRGLAGYLSEVSLTSHLSSLTLEESELSKGSAAVEAERTVNSLSKESPSTNEDQVSLKQTLAAIRNAAQAAARIQSAFRAHSFRKRQQREAVIVTGDTGGDEYPILSNGIRELSAASKLVFRNARDCNSAALSIQKKYRGWKGRKDFLALRQKVVKIQAHVRGYQVRKNYKVCWAVGILEKAILRWRRRGVGLRGFRLDDLVDESEDEDILKVFRKQKVDAAIAEAVSRVLSMIESGEARQQYHRILERYREAKAELESA